MPIAFLSTVNKGTCLFPSRLYCRYRNRIGSTPARVSGLYRRSGIESLHLLTLPQRLSLCMYSFFTLLIVSQGRNDDKSSEGQRNAAIAAARSGAPKTALPATRKSAPASLTAPTVLALTPPSTSTTAWQLPAWSRSVRAARILSRA